MLKYKDLHKAMEVCAGPECSKECPYYGKTGNGTTCRARLLSDAAVALAIEETARKEAEITCNALRDEVAALAEALELAEADERPAKQADADLGEAMGMLVTAIRNAEYWRGRAEALEWCMGLAAELPEEPEANADV